MSVNKSLARPQPLYVYAGLYAALFGVLLMLTYRAEFFIDVSCWTQWATHILNRGLGNAYELRLNNYNPLYHYVLWAFGHIAGSAENIVQHRNALKAVTLLFDFAGALLAASFLQGAQRRFVGSLWLLLNVGLLYNSLIWQQVDSIFTVFTFGAVVLALRQRPVWSAGCYALALAAKLQAIVFLPLILLLWLPLWRRQPRTFWQGGLLGLGLAVVLLAPFIWGGDRNYLYRIYQINRQAGTWYPYISMNAYNAWVLLLPETGFNQVSDALVKWGVSYKHWGLLAFFSASGTVLLPLTAFALRKLRRHEAFTLADSSLVFLTAAMLPLLLCYFCTEMHERYWHSGVFFLGAYALQSRAIGVYALASLAYFINLECVQQYFGFFKGPVLLFMPPTVAVMFLIVLLICAYRLYQAVRRSPEQFLFWQQAKVAVAM